MKFNLLCRVTKDPVIVSTREILITHMVHTKACTLVMPITACSTGMKKFNAMIGTKLLIHLRSNFLNDSV